MKPQRKVRSFDENDMKMHSCRRCLSVIGEIKFFKIEFPYSVQLYMIVAVLRPCFRFLSFKHHFKALNEWSLVFCLWNENIFQVEFQGNEKIEFFSQETNDFQILGNETMIIAGYEHINLFSLISWL